MGPRDEPGLRVTRLAMTVTCLALAAAACSVPPVEVGSARPAGGALGLRAESGQYLPGDQWPDACQLLTDEELKAILPQAEEVSRRPRGLNLTEIPDFLTGKGGGTEHIAKAGCDLGFKLPDDYDAPNSAISIMVNAIADPALAAKAYRQGKEQDDKIGGVVELGEEWEAEECYSSQPTAGSQMRVSCHTGQYYFETWGHTGAELAGADAYSAASSEAFRDRVLSQVVRTLVVTMA
ncbi:hypothetical protein [Nonomuraea dietziae]|uniref:hypothetical protein n=1 Tax=Nonomuraea dietziae TaxID=65515 RepID=UPI0033CAD652